MIDRSKIIIIGAGILLFVLVSVIILIVSDSPNQELKPVQYTLDFPIMLPQEPGYSGEYLYSHTPRNRWSQEEVDEWFVVPTGENLERLSTANDQVIKKILEAAP